MDLGTKKIRFQGKDYDYWGEVDPEGKACGIGAIKLAETEI